MVPLTETYKIGKCDTPMRLENRQFPKLTLSRVQNIVDKMPRQNLLRNIDRSSNKRESLAITFRTGYSAQYKQITTIVKKHLF